MIAEVIFWLSFFAILYPYLGYPILLLVFSIIRNKAVKKGNIMPVVSLAISAYNEEKVIAEKIRNSLQLDYPEDYLEIAVISDGSTDMTNDIIAEYAKKNHRIRPYVSPKNKGKTSCLNDFVPFLKGEIILFTDANSFLDKDVVHNIVRPFADPKVGFVTGITKYITLSQDKTVEVADLYSRMEAYIKCLESKIGSCAGADGAIFAIRKKLFSPMKSNDINDFVLPIQVVKQGFRGIVEEKAFCREEVVNDVKGEFNRQIRITARTLRAILSYKTLLNPFRYPLFSFEIFSHKLIKFTTPFWMILIFIANIYLATKGFLMYQISGVIQIFFYLFAAIGFLKKKDRGKWKLFDLSHSFLMVNLAYALGWFRYLKGDTYTSWLPKR